MFELASTISIMRPHVALCWNCDTLLSVLWRADRISPAASSERRPRSSQSTIWSLVGRTPVKRARGKFARAALRWRVGGRSNRSTEGGDHPERRLSRCAMGSAFVVVPEVSRVACRGRAERRHAWWSRAWSSPFDGGTGVAAAGRNFEGFGGPPLERTNPAPSGKATCHSDGGPTVADLRE